MTLYESDFHAWALEQAALVRSRSANAVDWDHVAEELEDLGKAVRGELKSRYRVLLMHLLKWLHQPHLQSHSWRSTIEVQRAEIADHIADNPSLRASDAEVFASAYRLARLDAVRETGLPKQTFSEEPPFTPEQARDDDFWPEPD
jgi:hypothetical protein